MVPRNKDTQAGSSSMDWPSQYGDLAHLGERFLCKEEVTGAKPVVSIESFPGSSIVERRAVNATVLGASPSLGVLGV